MRAHRILTTTVVALLAAITLYACGGGDSGGPAATTKVSAYVTDDLGGYDSVVLTLNSVELRHTSGRSCRIINGQLEIDAAELGRDQFVELVDTKDCEVGPYNRLHVEVAEDVKLQQTAGSQPQACKFVSYYDDSMRPNRLACANGNCSLDITGAVNLVAGNHEHVALDAELKEFTVDTSVTPCEVTLKVSPLHAGDKLAAGYRMSLSGTVSALNINDNRFTLTVRGIPYTVNYSGVSDADQPGLDTLLGRAAADQLRTTVRCQTIDATTTPPTCTAQTDAAQPLRAITVKAKGTVSLLSTSAHTFTLGYAGKTLLVNYTKADELGKVEGTLVDNAVAEAKLYGSDASFFFAREVEVE